jgi:TatA/E family protein of Tat protein translocase
MFDSKILLIFLAVMLVIFGTKRLRTIGSDLGAAMKGFKQAIAEGEETDYPAKQEGGRTLEPAGVARESEVGAATKNAG